MNLEDRWAETRRLLRAAARELGAGAAALTGFEEWLAHNELELALDALEDAGGAADRSTPRPDFWRAMRAAALSMDLGEHTARYEREINPGEETVRSGTWLYDGSVVGRLRLVRRSVAYGTGDHEDPPEVRDDRAGTFYLIVFDSLAHPGTFGTEDGPFDTEADAIASAARLTNGTARWGGGGDAGGPAA